MFSKIWNTSVGWGYVYQWWLSAFLYYLLVKKEVIHLKWQKDFNRKVEWLLKHFSKSIWRRRVIREDIYLEWDSKSFEDINFLKNTSRGVWYGFIQSKSKFEGIYGKNSQLKKIIKSFYENIHFKKETECVFVIASNVKCPAFRKSIEDDSVEFKIRILEECIFWFEICTRIDLPSFVRAIKDNDSFNMRRILRKNKKNPITNYAFRNKYKKITELFNKIYVFDDISSENIMASLNLISKVFTKEQIFLNTVYSATRRKILDPSDLDYSLYRQYIGTEFWWNIKNDIINWGFLLLK